MRKGDRADRHFYRSSDRLFQSDGRWFYETREGDCGPFNSREEAKTDLERYINTREYFDSSGQPASKPDAQTGELSLLDPDDY